MPPKTLRTLLIILDSLLGLAALLGGIGLLTGAAAPDAQLLHGSPFDDYTLPALALILVGGQALLAAFWMHRRHAHAALDSQVAGALAVAYPLLAVLMVGFPPGLAGGLLVLYAILGVLIFSLTAWLKRVERQESRPKSKRREG